MGALGVERHQPLELALGAPVVRRLVDAGDDAVLHHEAAVDHHGRHVAAVAREQERLDRIDDLPAVRAVKIDDRDVGSGTRLQPARSGRPMASAPWMVAAS